MFRELLFICLCLFLYGCTELKSANLLEDNTAVKKKSLIEEVKAKNFHAAKLCDANFTFTTPAEMKKQRSALSSNVSVSLTQALAQQKQAGVYIVTNVICQKLTGAKYTGTEQEWAQFLGNAVTGLKHSGGKEMQLVLVTGKDRVFMKEVSHKEYNFVGNFGKNRQIIFNLAVLNKENNTVYTISVSGARHLEKIVKNEFKRIVNSFELKSEL